MTPYAISSRVTTMLNLFPLAGCSPLHIMDLFRWIANARSSPSRKALSVKCDIEKEINNNSGRDGSVPESEKNEGTYFTRCCVLIFSVRLICVHPYKSATTVHTTALIQLCRAQRRRVRIRQAYLREGLFRLKFTRPSVHSEDYREATDFLMYVTSLRHS